MSKKKISGDELAVGGQAVMEGVMMRARDKYCVSCRNPKGKIERKVVTVPKSTFANLKKIPFIRGVFAMIDSLKIGYAALDYSADVAIEEKSTEKESLWFTVIIFTFSLILALGLFEVLPFWLTTFTGISGSLFFLTEGIVKFIIFVGYIFAISLMPDIKRVFMYHGAEHMAVHCYEKHGLSKKLNAKEAAKFSRIHKRCGTTFLFLVILVSMLIYSIVPINQAYWIVFVIRLAFLPVIAGIAFEFLQIVPKLSYKNPLKWILLAFELPGLGLQYITTRKPDLKQLEVAIDALKHVVK